jgi:predicted O-methyltransferase YrrM
MESILDSLEAMHREPHPVLLELEQRALDDDVPIVSRQTGRLLSTLVTAMQANRILEVGTGYGYATLWMALAQPPIGKIWTVEPDTRRSAVALEYFRRAGEDDYIESLNTPALLLLENFPQRNLDIVFIDANANDYEAYVHLAIPMLKLSGLVIVGNCLLDGMQDFIRYFLTHPALDATILPLGDGTCIGARKQ